MKSQVLLFVTFLLLIVGGVFLFKSQRVTSPKIENKRGFVPTNNQPVDNRPIKEVFITAKQWQFDPNEIKVKMGEKVRLKIKSVDVEHGFSLSAFGIDKTISPGKETVIEFVADKKGEFPFFCSIFCGEGHSGMRGKLVVE